MPTMDKLIYEKCQHREPKLIQDWEHIVNIDSPTGHGEGISAVGSYLIQKLKALHVDTETYSVSDNGGFNIVGTLKGTGKGRILLLVHMDTVLPVGSAAERPFRIDEQGKAYGPGVSDDKSGIVQCLHALHILRETGFDDFGKIVLFINCQEENGSQESRDLIVKLAKDADAVLCAETGVPGDGVCVNRAGSGNLEVDVSGVMAHAAYPWLGCNAADELMHQLLHINTLSDREKGTVVTTRIVESGTANVDKSVVPDKASAVLRVYAYLPEEISRVEHGALSLANTAHIAGTHTRTVFKLAFPPFVKTEKTLQLARLAQSIYAELGLTLNTASGAAATDAGWASTVNEAVLCSLGPVSGGQNHTDKEWADAKTVVPRLYLLARMLMHLGSKGLEAA